VIWFSEYGPIETKILLTKNVNGEERIWNVGLTSDIKWPRESLSQACTKAGDKGLEFIVRRHMKWPIICAILYDDGHF